VSVSRTANVQRPDELLDAIVHYLARHGITGLSLRPLARAVGSSPRMLLYYFGSKENLIARALARVRQQQRALYEQIEADTLAEVCAAIWQQVRSPGSEPLFRLFFEAYGLALRQPRRYRAFLGATIADWVEPVAAALRKEGYGATQARAYATVVVAGMRGFMLDYCATHDRARLDRAVRLWVRALVSVEAGLAKP
jgi:AcrR family transcriptional regulator